MSTVAAHFHMWVVFAIIMAALAAYISEAWPMELTSLGSICAILLFFQFFPMPEGTHGAGLQPARILQGFANPALIAVLCLLVMGQGLIRTGVLDQCANWILDHMESRLSASIAIFLVLFVVGASSGFLNNTPVVVIFVPIMQALATRYGISASRVMMPLSFVAILGGMTTLIGSSTNLLVNTSLLEIGAEPLGFFDITAPGVVLAMVGLIYAVFVVPRNLPDRAGLADTETRIDGGRQFIVQIEVRAGTDLVGATAPAGFFEILPGMTVRLIQRGEYAILPPFEDFTTRPGDVIVAAATRDTLRKAMAEHRDLFHPDLDGEEQAAGAGNSEETEGEEDEAPWREGDLVMAEVMIAPVSRMAGQTLQYAGFRYKTNCVVLGIQRRARMIRARITEIRLEQGDVLLVQGQRDDIRALRDNRDVILIERSREDLPSMHHAKRASIIFVGAVALAATGVLPIVVVAMVGAVAMVVFDVLNLRQAFRAVDPTIATAIAAALAMSVALRETGGATFLASTLVDLFADAGALTIVSMLFLVAAVMTNIISNNAVALLFTPVAVGLAERLDAPPALFAIAIVFAANCSFASPLGYQTNLLVMGPGHYRFQDFARAGIPLVLLVWLVFTGIAAFAWGL